MRDFWNLVRTYKVQIYNECVPHRERNSKEKREKQSWSKGICDVEEILL